MAKKAQEVANTPDNEDVETVVLNVEALHGRLATLKGEYMKSCRTVREEIANEYSTASDRGIRKVHIKSIIKERELARKIESLKADLEADELAEREMLFEKVKDLPLFKASIEAARRDGGEVLNELAN